MTLLRDETSGKVFPASQSARSVRDALVAAAVDAGAAIRRSHRVTGVERSADGFHRAGAGRRSAAVDGGASGHSCRGRSVPAEDRLRRLRLRTRRGPRPRPDGSVSRPRPAAFAGHGLPDARRGFGARVLAGACGRPEARSAAPRTVVHPSRLLGARDPGCQPLGGARRCSVARGVGSPRRDGLETASSRPPPASGSTSC